ncbi:MAG TPA: NADH-quinone oxidoreductase subunit NuoH [Longimicrobiales bacterium]|nr:NADH-quinone oxidoreductase subunit NuoH [Trueperaceae bacterium]HKJ93404.1 NADH-quinone oxidoreductase subunit NuoH [Longimicrobiales bacterium]
MNGAVPGDPLWVTFLKALVLILILLGGFAYMTLIERRLLGRFQHRLGPNRVGPFGMLQPIADAIKAIFKEDIVVSAADKVVYVLAPGISIVFALVAFGAIPGGPAKSLFGMNPWVMNLDIGVLYVLAMTSIGVYGIFLGGWASNSKYALLGSLRSSAQIISYELGMGLAVLSVIMIGGTLNLQKLVQLDVWSVSPWLWPGLVIAFIAFLIAGTAEINRTPFDLPEAEQELVAGYQTEYTSIKWALYQMSEYVNMFTSSAFISTLFLGGWRAPGFFNAIIPGMASWPIIWLLVKMAVFIFLFIWLKATLMRLRYDQLMRFGWLYLFEIGLFAALLTGAVIAFVL